MNRVLSLALVTASLAGCPSSGTGSPSGPGASASAPAPGAAGVRAPAAGAEPRGLAAASRSPAPLAEAAREVRLAGANMPRNPQAVDAVLDQVAEQEASAPGIRRAAQILQEARATLADRRWAGSGTPPWARWLHVGGIALIADLAQRACRARPGDSEVKKALDDIELPTISNSGGVDRDRMDAQRERLKAAADGCAGK